MVYEIYRIFILENIPRMLTQLDRDKDSPTYGSFDRDFWHYKIRDFSSIVLQQGCLSLAQLYLNDFKNNIYFKNEKIFDLASAAVDFWKDVQLNDGSFNEYYPFEHGYPPTVFSLYSVSETCRLLKIVNDDLTESIIKSCRFISKQRSHGAINQDIAAIVAMYSSYLVTKENWILDQLNRNIEDILSLQTEDGYFPEYGGADIGYLSVSLAVLAEYYVLSHNEKVIPPLENILNFIQYFVHPDGSIGGEYGSRNTEYFMPSGLEILAPRFPLAGTIADKLFRKPPIFHHSIDDRYLNHFILPSYINALIFYKNRNRKMILPYESNFHKYFKNAGLFIISKEKYYSILCISKGGLLKVFKKNEKDKEVVCDCGYRIKDKDNIYVTNWIDSCRALNAEDNCIKINGCFNQARFLKSTPLKHIGLRIASFLLGHRLIPMLKGQLIKGNKKTEIQFNREVIFKENEIEIHDSIFSKKKIKELSFADRYSLRYVPSSKFFNQNELRPFLKETVENFREININKIVDINSEVSSFSIKIEK
ncbi:MAG: hypothetical protein C3F06_00165 [Candidatus Methanoperedenaceae archaeon]|nr:MAG: hypothetical protein C3F06_00165 [Candidatus Methanoperedenaceae archaeon]